MWTRTESHVRGRRESNRAVRTGKQYCYPYAVLHGRCPEARIVVTHTHAPQEAVQPPFLCVLGWIVWLVVLDDGGRWGRRQKPNMGRKIHTTHTQIPVHKTAPYAVGPSQGVYTELHLGTTYVRSIYLVVNHDVVGGDAHLPAVDVLEEDNTPRSHRQVGALNACARPSRCIRFQ